MSQIRTLSDIQLTTLNSYWRGDSTWASFP